MSAHHAYVISGEAEAGIASALSFVEEEFQLETIGNPDVLILRYGLLSVEEARVFQNAVMRSPVKGDKKVIILSATRFFYQAQNALLKTFEEPPNGTFLFLVVPSDGILLPTLRSRLVTLQTSESNTHNPSIHGRAIVREFLEASKEGREKLIAKLLERTKADKEDEKAKARQEAVALVEGLTRAGYERLKEKSSPELIAFLSDLDTFTPMMHDTSTPLKIIFEHIQLTFPRGL